MLDDSLTALKKERNTLLSQYIKAQGKERIAILMKIIDIEDQLDALGEKTLEPKKLSHNK